jgi:hypothetical protein
VEKGLAFPGRSHRFEELVDGVDARKGGLRGDPLHLIRIMPAEGIDEWHERS